MYFSTEYTAKFHLQISFCLWLLTGLSQGES